MRKTLSCLAALTFTLALAGPAAAQDRDLAPDTEYNFEDHDVEGGYRSPLGESIIVREGMGRVTLVRPRLHFVPELLKSVETI